MRRAARAWKATPLPFEFHAALDEGSWERALSYYHAHPFHCPPVDTYDLLKAIVHATGVTADQIKQRFSDKIRVTLSLQKRTAEEIDWELFWDAINNGDSRTISMALTGARIAGASSQIGVAETCAVLLRSCGRQWRDTLVDSSPYGTVTKSNLIGTALHASRWDLACEMLGSTKVSKSDLIGLWPSITPLQWTTALQIIAACPKIAVPYEDVIPHLIQSGCDIAVLSEFLEAANVLGDSVVVAPLLRKAIESANWEFVQKCMEHLVDIGTVSGTAHKTFLHLCGKHGIAAVCTQLSERGIPLETITIEVLEECHFSS